MDPLVTIGIPTFNRADTLNRSIEQALSQTYTNTEIIIYDDGSSDDTYKVLSKFSSHKKIQIFSRENKGPPYPLNFIIDKSKGEFIIFFHDHDIFESNLVEQCINAFRKFDTALFVLFNDFDSYKNDVSNHRSSIELFDGKQELLKELNNKKSFASKFHACSMVKKCLQRIRIIQNSLWLLFRCRFLAKGFTEWQLCICFFAFDNFYKKRR